MPAVAGAARIPAFRCFDIRASPMRLRTDEKATGVPDPVAESSREWHEKCFMPTAKNTDSGDSLMALASHDTGTRKPDGTDAVAHRRVLLRRLVIRCPVTGLASDTGFELTELPQLTGEQALIDCLECGQDHTWRVEDAYLD